MDRVHKHTLDYLKSVPVEGGPPVILADVGEYTDRSATLSPDDSIIVASTLYVTRHEAMSGRRPMVG